MVLSEVKQMERLTRIAETGDAYYPKCFEKPCCGWKGCLDSECELLSEACKKLAEYEQLEEQGLLVRLPCKIGTEVFCFFPGDSHYTKCQMKKIEIRPSIFGNICYFAEPVGQRGRCCRYFDYEFGKFLFLTREEVEKKLEEMKK